MSNRSARSLSKREIMRALLRRERKAAFLERCSIQAKAHKAMRIVKLQGKNGHSMNAALLKAHGLNPKGGEA